MNNQPTLPLLHPGDPFPPISKSWPRGSPAPGLLAVGGALDVATLRTAYASTIFPWFSAGEPILWWSPDPRMVLKVADFKLHHSLRKTLHHFRTDTHSEIRFDSAFHQVIGACARAPRHGQSGTWIGPRMRTAYQALFEAGGAHSVETWINGQLVAGLYCVSVGRALFGESMFTEVTDGSKIALSALVAWCRHHRVPLIDCQQNTHHLASLGAHEISRQDFAERVATLAKEPSPEWRFEPIYWDELVFSAQSPQ